MSTTTCPYIGGRGNIFFLKSWAEGENRESGWGTLIQIRQERNKFMDNISILENQFCLLEYSASETNHCLCMTESLPSEQMSSAAASPGNPLLPHVAHLFLVVNV